MEVSGHPVFVLYYKYYKTMFMFMYVLSYPVLEKVKLE